MKTYSIYQVNREDSRSILFMRLSFLKKMGIEPTRDKYNKVYGGEIEDGKTTDVLERIYTKFNVGRPQDFRGHSLSVADVVELDGSFYFCDSYGFKQINF